MRKSKKIAVVGAASVALVGGGVAYAYFTTTGSGTGSATTSTGTTNNLSFVQDAVNPLFPGDSSQPLKVKVTNDGTESAYVATVEAYITTDKSGCTGDDYKIGGSAAPSDAASAVALSWTATDLAAGGSADATSTIQFNNKATNQDPCKGAAVTIHYLAS